HKSRDERDIPTLRSSDLGVLGADAQLVAEEDDKRGVYNVRQERNHEDLVVEDAVEHGPQHAEDGVERGHHGDRQIRFDDRRDLGPDQQAGHDSHDEAQYGDHDVPFPVIGWAERSIALAAAGSWRSSAVERAVRMP